MTQLSDGIRWTVSGLVGPHVRRVELKVNNLWKLQPLVLSNEIARVAERKRRRRNEIFSN